MKQKFWILFLLSGLFSVSGCGGGGSNTRPPSDITMAEQMARYAADDYVYIGGEWINRDGRDYNDGTTKNWFAVSYNFHSADEADDFEDKIDASKVGNQTYWSQYTSYHPGGRQEDDAEAYPWAGTHCKGLVYRSAIKAGFSIATHYLNDPVTNWLNLGEEVITPQEGDLVLMDMDTSNNHPERVYEHLGVMWGGMPDILSAVAIYRSPFLYKAGIQNKDDYDSTLALEFPNQHFHVYKMTYIRLPE